MAWALLNVPVVVQCIFVQRQVSYGLIQEIMYRGGRTFYHPMIFPLKVKIKIHHDVEPEFDEKKLILDPINIHWNFEKNLVKS